MNTSVSIEPKPGDEALTIAGARRENPHFFLVAGFVLMANGLAAVALISLGGLSPDKTAAGLLGISGFTLLLHAFSARGGSQVIPLEFLMALLHLAMAFIALLYPFVEAFTFAQWLAAFLLAEGGLRVAIAVNFRGARGAATVAAISVAELLLGALLLLVPGASGEAVGLVVGADLLLGGICMVNIFWTGRAPCAAA